VDRADGSLRVRLCFAGMFRVPTSMNPRSLPWNARPSAPTRGYAANTTSVTHSWPSGRIPRHMQKSAASRISCHLSRTSSQCSSMADSFILSRELDRDRVGSRSGPVEVITLPVSNVERALHFYVDHWVCNHPNLLVLTFRLELIRATWLREKATVSSPPAHHGNMRHGPGQIR
jgi:hypothetical protein